MNQSSIFTNVINTYLPEPHSSLLNGIVFGSNLRVNQDFYQQMKTVGLLHIVVLSGMNIVLMSGIISTLTLRFGKQLSTLITILTVVLFIFFVQPQAPIIRAGVMSVATFAGIIFGKKTYVYYLLLFSAAIIYVVWPDWVRSISFQLSYGATLGILLFGQTKDNKEKEQIIPAFLYLIWSEIKISMAAQIFTAPIIFINFRQISLISPVANLMVSFLIGPIMFFGFLTSILGKINWFLGLIPSYICYAMLSYMIYIIDILSKIPFASVKF